MLNKSFLLLIGFISAFSVQSQAAQTCSAKLSGASEFAELHTERLIAEQANFRRVRSDLMAITGRVPIECNGVSSCIQDRYTDENKEVFRSGFLIKRIEAMGFTPDVQKFKKKSKITSSSSSYSGKEPFNPDDISDSDAKIIFSNINFRDLKSYLKKVRGMDKGDKANFVRTALQEDFLREIKKELKAHKDRKINNYKGVGINVALTDVRHWLARIKKWKDQNPPDENEALELNDSDDIGLVHNIIVTIEGTGKTNEVLEVTTHYDSQGVGVAGADDNGSGIATSLEMMRLFKSNPPKKSIRFIFTDMEESTRAGAEEHVSTIKNLNEDFIGAFVIDMFGFAELGQHPKFVSEVGIEEDYDTKKSYEKGFKMGEALAYQYAKYVDRSFEFQTLYHQAAADTGDHGAYWDEDLPAIFIAQPVKGANPANHSAEDKIENMNWGFYQEVSKLIIETVSYLSEAQLNPNYTQDPNQISYLDSAYDPNQSPNTQRLAVDDKPVKKQPWSWSSDSPKPKAPKPNPPNPPKPSKSKKSMSPIVDRPVGWINKDTRRPKDEKSGERKVGFLPPDKKAADSNEGGKSTKEVNRKKDEDEDEDDDPMENFIKNMFKIFGL